MGRRGISLTEGALRLVGESRKGLRLVGTLALGFEGLELLRWRGWSRHRALGPSEVHDDDEPEEYKQDELIDKMMRPHGVAPSKMS